MYMHIHTGHIGSWLVSLAKIGVPPGLGFSLLGLFTELPELLHTGEASTTRAVTGSCSTGNSGQNRASPSLVQRDGQESSFHKGTK